IGQRRVVDNGAQEALAVHLAILAARKVERSHHSLGRTVVVVDLRFFAEFVVVGIAITVSFFDGKKILGADVEGNAIVLGIDDGDLVRLFGFGDGGAIVKEGGAGL